MAVLDEKVKQIRQSYPRRKAMLATKFEPLSDVDFRKLVADGSAIPGGQGSDLFVAKWKDGPGIGADAFLAALKARGSHLVVRRYGSDVNIRVVRGTH
jgi:hypothetical protein